MVLNDLYVEEEYRQKGISVALIDKAKELCRETGACQLSLKRPKQIGSETIYILKPTFTRYRN